MSLAATAIDRMAKVSATRTRASAGSYVNGRWVAGSTSAAAIMIVAQPVSGQDLLRMPEGERTTEMRSVWTRSDLRTADTTAQTEADLLTFQGKTWKVTTLFDRPDGGFYKAIVSRHG